MSTLRYILVFIIASLAAYVQHKADVHVRQIEEDKAAVTASVFAGNQNKKQISTPPAGETNLESTHELTLQDLPNTNFHFSTPMCEDSTKLILPVQRIQRKVHSARCRHHLPSR